MRRHTVPLVITCLAVAFLALLTYGVSHQATNSSIDSLVARGRYPPAPNATRRPSAPRVGPAGDPRRFPRQGRLRSTSLHRGAHRVRRRHLCSEHAERLLRADGGTVLGITYQDNALDD